MPGERIERSVGTFWWNTCGIDNGRRNAYLRDTPWTGYTPDKILVCTLWEDGIVNIFDPQLGDIRRFVRLGDYRTTWNSSLKTKGNEARENIEQARRDRRRFIGFEIKRRENTPTAQVEYFYLDRYHELKWLPAGRDEHIRLKITEEFIKRGPEMAPPPNVAGNTIGQYFELVPWVGAVPGQDQTVAAAERVEAAPPTPHPEPILPIETAEQVAPESAPPEPAEPEPPPAWFNGWGGGESEHHKALKAYVAAHPALFGASPEAEAIQEFELLSGDRIDVVFQTPSSWLAIEVKSAISGHDDCRRGIFQVVKYRAVLKAQASWENPDSPRTVRVLLALESELPVPLRPAASKFGCEVVEEVKPSVLPTVPVQASAFAGAAVTGSLGP